MNDRPLRPAVGRDEQVVREHHGTVDELWSVDGLEPAHGIGRAVGLMPGLVGEPGGLMTIEHTLLPPGLAHQHERGWAAVARQLADKPAAPAPPRVPIARRPN